MKSTPFSPTALAGKTILVTGASSGIGRQTAIALSNYGANLVIHGRNEERLNDCLRSLAEGNHSMVTCDLGKPEELPLIIPSLPKLDGVVFNAGIVKWAMVKFQKHQDLEEILQLNFKSVVSLQQLLLSKRKINSNASLVYISSYATVRPSISQGAYAASKAALSAFAKVSALELASKKIRVNTILPAMVDTNILSDGIIQKEEIEKIVSAYPLNRIGHVDDISSLITFLLSDGSSWMTGSEIIIDGGASLL